MRGLVYFPFELPDNPSSGSGVRPLSILKGFQDANIQVDVVCGRPSERRKQVRALCAQGGLSKFDWIYAESSTMPMALSARDFRLIPHPFVDATIWRQAGARGVPVGLFYRDVYWRFPVHRAQPFARRAVREVFYRLEWLQIERTVAHLFLPSLQMNEALPRPWPQDRLSSLPPGCIIEDRKVGEETRSPGRLRLLYVGGVAPPFYDLRPMLTAVANKPFVKLTVCCREPEWSLYASLYEPLLGPNIEIVHRTGGELTPLYSEADAVAIVRADDPYLKFAMPVKIFEALGWGKPIITNVGTAAADFVQRERLGWVTQSQAELDSLLTRLAHNRLELDEVTTRVQRVRSRHTWKVRAQQIADTLMSYKRVS